MKTYPTRYAEYARGHKLTKAEAYARDLALNPRAALAPFYDWLLDQQDAEDCRRIRSEFQAVRS